MNNSSQTKFSALEVETMNFNNLNKLFTALFLFTTSLASAHAGVVVESGSGYISSITGINISGNTFDVTFVLNSPSAAGASSDLWENDAEFSAAITALITELNTVNSFIVTTASGTVNNDFSVARTITSGSHLRAIGGGVDWFENCANCGLQGIIASFSEIQQQSNVPEPASIALLALGLLALKFSRCRYTDRWRPGYRIRRVIGV